jgi:DNA-binding MarR family transcriptional regulator
MDPMTDVNKIAEEIVLIMPRISRKIVFDLLHNQDIPHAQLFVINILFRQGPCRISDIVKELQVAAPTASGILDRLEASGYVSRIEDKKDRRVVMVDLTAKGRKVANELKSTIVTRWTEILKKLSPEDATKYLEILRKIKEAI